MRQTRPSNYDWYARGGPGAIPRRGVNDVRLLETRQKLSAYAGNSPLRLLALLPDIDPAVGLATWNALRLTCPPLEMGGVRIVAVKPEDVGADATNIDEQATKAIESLWESQPNEIGGLTGLQSTLTLHALFSGLPCCEAVPGARLEGVRRVLPVDSLSILFKRESPDADVQPYQKQSGAGAPASGEQLLNRETFKWRSIDSFADDPYGRAPYAPALGEVLCDLALMKDLRDCIHNAAWPRYVVNVEATELYKLAQEQFNLTSEKAGEWVLQQIDALREALGDVGPDENAVAPSGVKVTVLEGGKGLGNITGVLEFLRRRVVQSLKTLPILMGLGDSSTESFATVEWRLVAAGLETIRGMVVGILVDIANLHLRLLGLPFVAKAVYEPIQTSDAVADANVETVKIKNAQEKYNFGALDHNSACKEITGNDAQGPAPPRQQGRASGVDGQDQKRANDAAKQGATGITYELLTMAGQVVVVARDAAGVIHQAVGVQMQEAMAA